MTHDTNPKNRENHRVWCRFYESMDRLWQDYDNFLHPYYIENVHHLKPFANKVPSIDDINHLLAPIGWTAQLTDGYISPWDFAQLIDNNSIPISRYIRSENELFFAKEPDFIHDIFGHIPSLFSPEYRALLKIWSQCAAVVRPTNIDQISYYTNKMVINESRENHDQSSDLSNIGHSVDMIISKNPSLTFLLDKVYFWLFEFGVIRTRDGKKILGAGLISSTSELKSFIRESKVTRTLTLETILHSTNISDSQDSYLDTCFDEAKHLISRIQNFGLNRSFDANDSKKEHTLTGVY